MSGKTKKKNQIAPQSSESVPNRQALINQTRIITMPAKIKMRSVSVEDLGIIVKQMIDGVLEDNDQVAKLHQAVFEQYYSKKMEELKEVKAKIEADNKFSQETENSCSEVMKSSIAETIPRSQETEDAAASNLLVNELHSPVVHHVLRRQKYVKVAQETANINNSNIALSLANYNTTTDLTQTKNDSVMPMARSKERIKSEKNGPSNVEVIVWRSSSSKKGAAEQNGQFEKTREISVQFKSKGEIAFENWKREKTNTYHRIFSEEQKRKRLEQAARTRQIEKKEAAKEAYLYWRRQQDARQKLINTRKRILGQMESQKLQSMERRSLNSQAFKTWKRKKDIKLRERKMYMMAYGQQNYPREQRKPHKPKPAVGVTFNMWLDQLDCVLHQKYLRERRYLVHSFYCQPSYFGTAALQGR